MLDVSDEKDRISRYVRGEDVRDAICSAASKVAEGTRLPDATSEDAGKRMVVTPDGWALEED